MQARNATQLTWFCWKMSLVRHIESLPSNHMQLESFSQTRLHLIYFVLLCICAFYAVPLIHSIHWVAVTMCIMLAAINCVFSSLNDPNTSYGERDEKMNKIYFYPFFYAFQFIGLRCAHGLQWHCKYTIQCRVISNYALAWFIFKFFFFVFNNDLCPIQLNIPMHIRGLSCAIGARAHIVHCALQSEHNLNMDNLNINNLDLCCSFSNHLMHFFEFGF